MKTASVAFALAVGLLLLAGVAGALPQQPMQTMGASGGSASAPYDGGSVATIKTGILDAGNIYAGGNSNVGISIVRDDLDVTDNARVRATASIGSDPSELGTETMVVGSGNTSRAAMVRLRNGTPGTTATFFANGDLDVGGAIDAGTVTAKEARFVNVDAGSLFVAGNANVAGTLMQASVAVATKIPIPRTINFASTADGACSTTGGLGATGATDGMACTVGTPNAAKVTGAMFACWGDGVDTYSIQMCCNNAGGSCDPPSATFSLRFLP